MINKNDPRFLSPWGERLAELGLEIRDVYAGRYVQIDLSKPRKEPEEFAEFGEFDTFTVLNPDDVPPGVWLYLNNKRPESRIPLHYLSRLETVADRFYLQHDTGWEGVVLHIILGGDLRALSVEPSNKGAVTVRGAVDVTDRPGRELGIVSVPGVATELTLEAVRAVLESLDGKDFATESTLEAVRALLESLDGKDFATDAKLEAVRALLESLNGKDFATDAKLEAVRALLESLNGKDFATDAKLEAVRVLLESLDGKDFATDAKLEAVRVLLESLDGKDFATDAKLEAVRVLLESLDGKDFATDAKLEAVRTLLASLENKNFATEDTLSSIANTLDAILAELQTQTALLESIRDNTAPAAPED